MDCRKNKYLHKIIPWNFSALKYISLSLFLSFGFSDGFWVNYGWELFEHVTDARNAALGSATTAYQYGSPTSSLMNPVFSNLESPEIVLTHQSRFAGILNNDLVSFQIQRESNPIHFNILYEGIGKIPDTRNMLLDWGNDGKIGTNDAGEGNGILDEGERLDADQIRFFSQHQVGIHGSFNHIYHNIPVGIGVKVLSYSLDNNFAMGVGIDLGVLKQFKGTDVGIVARNLPASGLIWDNGTVEGTTTSISIGVHRPFEFTEIPVKLHSMFKLDMSTTNRHLDSQIGFSSISIDGAFGIEGIYKAKLFIRLGRNAVNSSTGGLGVRWDGFGVDYAFLSTNSDGGLGNHHLISLRFSIDWVKTKLIEN